MKYYLTDSQSILLTSRTDLDAVLGEHGLPDGLGGSLPAMEAGIYSGEASEDKLFVRVVNPYDSSRRDRVSKFLPDSVAKLRINDDICSGTMSSEPTEEAKLKRW